MFGLLIAILLGLAFGSFGSVLLSRWWEATTLQQAGSILWWRSACPHCKRRLHPHELIPLLSFLIQKGKCRSCHKPIAWLYPILELGSALIFGLGYWYLGDLGIGQMLFWVTTGWILWLLLVYDVLWYEVHIPLVMLGAIMVGTGLFTQILPRGILRGGLVFMLFFLLMYVAAKQLVRIKYGLKEEGIWMGDVIIAPYLGILWSAGLPPQMLVIDQILMFLMFLTISGGIGIIRYLIQNKYYQKKASFLHKKMADQAVPFLPAMILSVAIVIILQKPILVLFGF